MRSSKNSSKGLENMSLRINEDGKRFNFHKLPYDEREGIIKKLKEFLFNRKEIILAVICGGFI